MHNPDWLKCAYFLTCDQSQLFMQHAPDYLFFCVCFGIKNNTNSINNFLQEQGFKTIQKRLESNSFININNQNEFVQL